MIGIHSLRQPRGEPREGFALSRRREALLKAGRILERNAFRSLPNRSFPRDNERPAAICGPLSVMICLRQ